MHPEQALNRHNWGFARFWELGEYYKNCQVAMGWFFCVGFLGFCGDFLGCISLKKGSSFVIISYRRP